MHHSKEHSSITQCSSLLYWPLRRKVSEDLTCPSYSLSATSRRSHPRQNKESTFLGKEVTRAEPAKHETCIRQARQLVHSAPPGITQASSPLGMLRSGFPRPSECMLLERPSLSCALESKSQCNLHSWHLRSEAVSFDNGTLSVSVFG